MEPLKNLFKKPNGNQSVFSVRGGYVNVASADRMGVSLVKQRELVLA